MDKQSFEHIFKTNFSQLQHYALLFVNDISVAKDIVCDCFAKLWTRRNDHKNTTIPQFLYTEVRKAALYHLSKPKQNIVEVQKYLDLERDITKDPSGFSYMLLQELHAKINTLAPRLKAVIQLSMRDLTNAEIAAKLGVSIRTVQSQKSMAYKKLRLAYGYNSPKPTNKIYSTNSVTDALYQINFKQDEINAELIKYLARHPHKMCELDPYKFEKLVVELLKDMGYDVYHTPQTRDGGRDIIAVFKSPSNDKIVTIIECKRNRGDRLVGIDIVKSFLYTLREQDRANAGWIVTSSNFSPEAIKKQKEYKWLLSLKDNNHLADWCSNYGKWKRSGSGGLWLPDNPLG